MAGAEQSVTVRSPVGSHQFELTLASDSEPSTPRLLKSSENLEAQLPQPPSSSHFYCRRRALSGFDLEAGVPAWQPSSNFRP